jgi:DNA repair protein RecO (recombination protein O)
VATLQCPALVLRSVEFGESDRILHLLTPRTGRLTVIAKGARRSVKRFPGTLDFFNLLQVQVERRRPTSMARLEHARLERTYLGLRSWPSRYALGCYILELFDRLAPEGGVQQDHARLFGFARTALGWADEREPDLELRTLLELGALDVLGLRPELRHCVRCAVPIETRAGPGGEVRFHVGDGGPLCEHCTEVAQQGLSVHVGTLLALDRSLRFDPERRARVALGGQALAEARLLLGRFLRFHVGVELRSERFLDERLLTPPGPGGRIRPPESPG